MSEKQTKKGSKSSLILLFLIMMFAGLAFYASFQTDKPKEGSKYEWYRAKADSLYHLHQYNKALTHYKTALDYEPNDRYVLEQMAEIERKDKQIGFAEIIGAEKLDEAKGIVATHKKDGYIVVGNTNSFGNGKPDAWIVRMDNDGLVDWKRTYGDIKADEIQNIIATPDGHYLAVGMTTSKSNGKQDAWLLKLNEKGRLVWEKRIGGSLMDVVLDAALMSNGDYVMTGFVQMKKDDKVDMLVKRIDVDGNEIWSKNFGGEAWDIGMSIVATKGDNILVGGHTESVTNGKEDAWIVKLSGEGNEIWSKNFGGEEKDVVASLAYDAQTDGCFAVGHTESFGNGMADVWVLKIDKDGKDVWKNAIGGEKADMGKDIIITEDGNLAITGFTMSYGKGFSDVWLLKMSNAGSLLWKKEYGTAGTDGANVILEDEQGNFIMAGATTKQLADMWVIKVDKAGNATFNE